MRSAVRACAALVLSAAVGACSGGAPAGSAATPSVALSAPPAVAYPAPSEVSAMPASPSPAQPSATAGPFTLSSAAFAPGGAIPRGYTCDGADGSPELAWSGAPAGTAAFVLVVDDPDARNFVHWIVLDVPTTENGLPKGVDPGAAIPKQGTNDFGKHGWGGPCPPSGTHRYRFTLTALSSPLGLGDHPGGDAVRAALEAAGAGTLGTATLEATYRRGG